MVIWTTRFCRMETRPHTSAAADIRREAASASYSVPVVLRPRGGLPNAEKERPHRSPLIPSLPAGRVNRTRRGQVRGVSAGRLTLDRLLELSIQGAILPCCWHVLPTRRILRRTMSQSSRFGLSRAGLFCGKLNDGAAAAGFPRAFSKACPSMTTGSPNSLGRSLRSDK
jgi:hypothetical protein